MVLKGRMSRTIRNVSFLALDLSLFVYLGLPTPAGTIHARRPAYAHAAELIEPHKVAGLQNVYIADGLSFPIVKQPQNEPNFVSKNVGALTQFSSASQYGNIGLLAHNYLSGRFFFNLHVGQEIRAEYEDGTSEIFVVTEILRYQALEPKSPFSSFKNLRDAEEILSAAEMFQRAYGGERRITFQTCIARYGNASWGRLFVVATPKALVGMTE